MGFSKLICMALMVFQLGWATLARSESHEASAAAPAATETTTVVETTTSGGGGVFSRAWAGGFVVFSTLLLLLAASCVTWAIIGAKWLQLQRIGKACEGFIKSFWDSRSLNDLNGRLQEYPYSPVREVFRSGYAELVRASQLKDQTSALEVAVGAAMDNLNRSLQKAKQLEKRRLEKYLPYLATLASVTPFVGLFGTVWGIMNAFESIARSGSASLASVAPGIAEALTSTAFGLAAAIPAVVGYNLFNNRLRIQMGQIDGFCADFLNIVERYLVTDKSKGQGAGHAAP